MHEIGALLAARRLCRPVGHVETGGRSKKWPADKHANDVDDKNVKAERAQILDVEASDDAAASRVLGGNQRIVVVAIVFDEIFILVLADILVNTSRLGCCAASFDCRRCRRRREHFGLVFT